MATRRAEPSQAGGEQLFRNGRHVVESGDAVMVDALIWSDWKARWDRPDRARNRRDNNVVENRDRLITGDNQDGATFLIRCFQQPELALSYHGSASVIASALASASRSSSIDWGTS